MLKESDDNFSNSMKKLVEKKEEEKNKIEKVLQNKLNKDIIYTDEHIEKFKEILEEVGEENRSKLAKKILEYEGLKDIKVRVIKNIGLGVNGYCKSYIRNNKLEPFEYVLNKEDHRSNSAKLKTMFHELYHAKYSGLKTDEYNIGKIWTKIEETFTETTAHFITKSTGIDDSNILVSYSHYILDLLPKLKQLDEFKHCNSFYDFGKEMYKYRFGDKKNAEWREIYEKTSIIKIDSSYYDKYFEYLKNNKSRIFEIYQNNMMFKVDKEKVYKKIDEFILRKNISFEKETIENVFLMQAIKEMGDI